MSSRRAIDIAGELFEHFTAFNPLFPNASESTARAWAEIIDRHPNIPRATWIEAVTVFYEQPGSKVPVPGDILTIAKAIHQDEFQRQPIDAIERHNDRMDARLASRIEEVADSKSVDLALVAYRRREPNPLAVPCRYCRAIPGRRCTSGGLVMRGYHPARIHSADAQNELPPGGSK